MRPASSAALLASALLCAAAGCSVARSIGEAREAERAIGEADEALGDGEYEAALAGFRKAKDLLLALRAQGYWALSDPREIASIDDKAAGCVRMAEDEGFVRVGDRFLRGAALGPALTEELRRFFRDGPAGHGAGERVVAEEMTASCVEGPGGGYDVTISAVIRNGGAEGEFEQDAWEVVRSLMEGCWGHGFASHAVERFPSRAYMGFKSGWGRSERPGAENRLVGLKGRVDKLTVAVEKGEARQGTGGAPGGLSAVGPYWRKEPYRAYAMKRADAEGLEWERPELIPDSALHGLMAIAPTAAAAGGGERGGR